MIENQIGRRNLTDKKKTYFIGKYYRINKISPGRYSNVATVATLKTIDEIAKKFDISPRTVRNSETFADKLDEINEVSPELAKNILEDKTQVTKKEVSSIKPGFIKRIMVDSPDMFDKVKYGEVSFTEIKKEERLIEINRIKDNIEEENKKEELINIDKNFKYDVLSIDPPWAYEEKGAVSSINYDPSAIRGTTPYPTMGIEQIRAINLPLKEDAVVFLWTTHAFLEEAFKLLRVWGLTYKATIVWDKVQMGMGRNIRLQCEFCLLATKGSPIIEGSATRDIITEQRRQHSRKPIKFYELVLN